MNQLIIAREKGKLGILTLNRPKALNAINAALQQEIIIQLEEWKTHPIIQSIVINSAHPKAFCAGGDIRQIASYIKSGQYDQAMDIFLHNYQLVDYVAHYSKPVISLMDGITMGGGIGLGSFASHRIVTERATLAMPEVMIGLTPDAGSNLLFSNAPGYMGLRMMLTGKRFHAEEAIKLGFADYMLSSSMIEAILLQLETKHVDDVLSFFKKEKKYHQEFLQEVETVYNAPDIETIIARLKNSRYPWAAQDLQEISQAAPFSLLVTYQSWHNNVQDLRSVLQQDLNLISHLVIRSDFVEGVRASIIDKDRCPKWNRNSVSPKVVDACFVSSYKLYG